MDAHTTKSPNRPVLLVDYDFYAASSQVQQFVRKHQDTATLIALVGTPNVEDPEIDDPTVLDTDWDVVIRNPLGHPDDEFKISALDHITNHSTYRPALAVDLFNHQTYFKAGVMMVLDGEYFE